MSRYEYIRRKIRKGINKLRRNRKQKLNAVMTLSVMAAVVLVVVLSIVKIYSAVNTGNTSQETEENQAQATVETAAAETNAVETVADVAATPRPKAVALTFDDGPSRANDGKILNTLQQYGAHATFFVLGDRARVDGDILQMQLAAGCEIASHSWNHPNLSKAKWKKVKSQIDRTNRIVKKLTDGYEISYLRPPYGAISDKMRKKVKMPMVLWSLDTLDWKSRNAKKIFKQVKKNVSDGDIILMHDIYETTAEACEEIVPWLQEQGYDILTVSELMARKGKTLEKGKAYLDGR